MSYNPRKAQIDRRICRELEHITDAISNLGIALRDYRKEIGGHPQIHDALEIARRMEQVVKYLKDNPQHVKDQKSQQMKACSMCGDDCHHEADMCHYCEMDAWEDKQFEAEMNWAQSDY